MKRFFAFVLVLLFLPLFALADEPDPIVGTWYMYFDVTFTPEMASSMSGYDRIISVYTFLSDQSVVCVEHNSKDNTGEPAFGSVGKWEKSGNEYNYSLIGLGEGKAYIKDERLYLGMYENTVYFGLHKLIPINPYKDYIYK